MPPFLTVKNVSRSFGRNRVLRDVSFSIEPGRLVGLVGENGSGKSTLLKIITGILKPDQGEAALSATMGYCPQEPLLFEQLTILEHFRCFAAGYGLPDAGWQNRMEELLTHFRFKDHLRKQVAHLSGGTRQKLNLSLALLHQPDLLILDEPYAGFDWETYLRFWDYAEAQIGAGRSILVVTHFLSDQSKFHQIFDLKNGTLT